MNATDLLKIIEQNNPVNMAARYVSDNVLYDPKTKELFPKFQANVKNVYKENDLAQRALSSVQDRKKYLDYASNIDNHPLLMGMALGGDANYLDNNIKTLNKNGIKVSSPDDLVTIYHGVSNNSSSFADKNSGIFRPGTYFSTDREATKMFAGESGKIHQLHVPVSDLGFVQDEGMAGSKGVIIKSIDKLVKNSNGIYKAVK